MNKRRFAQIERDFANLERENARLVLLRKKFGLNANGSVKYGDWKF